MAEIYSDTIRLARSAARRVCAGQGWGPLMRFVGVLLATLVAAPGCGEAFAEPLAAANESHASSSDAATLLLFGGADAWRNGGFAHGWPVMVARRPRQ